MLIYRQKILLALLEALGGLQPATDFQKHLFLYTTLCEKVKSYGFVPYKYGCYSFQASTDKNKLIEKGYLKDAKGWELAKGDINFSHGLKRDDAKKIMLFRDRFHSLKGKKLIHHVYSHYPYFAINSEIADSVLTDDELRQVDKARPVKRRKALLATIGYEGGSIEDYINRLITNDIRVIVDVRKNPVSRKYGFSKNTLARLLGRVGIDYVHIPELGIESQHRQDLVTQSDYDRLFSTYKAQVLPKQSDALEALLDVYRERKRMALTCFEKNYCQCHRSAVAEKLIELDGCIDLEHL